MRTILLICFLGSTILSFSFEDKNIIVKIDSINAAALKSYYDNEIEKALHSINKSKRLSESVDDVYGKALSNFIQGQIYASIQEYEAAESRFVTSLKLSLEIKDNYLIAYSYLNLGRLHRVKNLIDEAQPHFQKALEYTLKGDVRDHHNLDKQHNLLFNIQIDLCQVYLKNDLIEKALTYLLRAEDNLSKFNADPNTYGYFNYTHGLYFLKKELYSNATNKFNEALAYLYENNKSNRQDYNLLLIHIYGKLAFSLDKQGLDKLAYNALLKYNNYNDIRNVELQKARNNIVESKFLIQDYKNDAQIANTEKIQQIEITNKVKKLNIIIIIILVLFLTLSVTLYRNYVSKRILSNILKTQNEKLEIARNEAVKLSDLKSKFISNVTHELRTPLYGVVGITTLLLENNDLNEDDNKLIKSLKYSGDYLLNLVNDILEFSKVESQKIELKSTPINLNNLIKNIVDSFDFRLKETNNKINVLIDRQIPPYIKCDKVRLSQVLINLIGNSIKFTKNGWINIRVIKIDEDLDNVSLRFEIEDNGCGIPENKFDSIFDNFSQLDDDNNVNYQGTGLGLSITKNLIELFGSKIELNSEVGVGTMFSFNLSFQIDTNEMDNVKPRYKAKTKLLNKTYKVLVAEDNKINQIVTQNLLSKANYETVLVSNGLDALNTIKKEMFDLVLMDINMPIMNGVEATNCIREFNAQVPIIALTASNIDSIKKDPDSNVFNDIICKPFDNYEFYQVIETNIQASKAKVSEKDKLKKAC